MNVLITGGHGFLGSHIAERFARDKHKVVIVDSQSGTHADRPKFKHKSYELDSASPYCENIFESKKIDLVIHLSNQKKKDSLTGKLDLEKDTDFSGLANMLNLAEKYGVTKFVIVIHSSIYGNPGNEGDLPFKETDIPKPVTPEGMSGYIKEYYCKKWSELFNLKTLCIRASNIYGPGRKLAPGSGVITSFIDNILNRKNLTISGYGAQTRDFIYIDDFIDALYIASIDKECSGVVNISSNKEYSINDLANTLSNLFKVKKIDYKNELKDFVKRSRLDNSRIRKLGWKPKLSLEEGLKKTYRWYKEKRETERKNNTLASKIRKVFKNLPREIIAYIENILIFLVIAFMQYNHLFLDLYSFELGLDYSLIYIAVMGILWGQRQAYLAMILSSALYIGTSLLSGTDIVTFIYSPENLLRLSAYILIGILTGYSIEKRNRDLEAKDFALKSLRNKYDFLNDIYNETRVVKDELQSQIIETEDSFGVIYGIVQEVDSLEIEKIFSASIDAIERIMKTDSVSIYTVNRADSDNKFLRLKTRSNSLKEKIENSIKVSKHPELKEVLKTKSLYVNYKLKENVPVMIAPVIDDRNVIAIVSLHKVAFETLTMHYENLFQTVISLVTNALKRAYFFEASLKDKRYIPNTRILNSDTFDKILEEVKKKEEELGMSYSILKIAPPHKSINTLSNKIIEGIRDNDYIGMSKKKEIFILLSNTRHSYAHIVIDRLKSSGIKSVIVSEGTDDL
ncbi:MAG: NAD-dependent epimerase/dehydratase family protein [Candidatus Humimicrobiaceae bacterium]